MSNDFEARLGKAIEGRNQHLAAEASQRQAEQQAQANAEHEAQDRQRKFQTVIREVVSDAVEKANTYLVSCGQAQVQETPGAVMIRTQSGAPVPSFQYRVQESRQQLSPTLVVSLQADGHVKIDVHSFAASNPETYRETYALDQLGSPQIEDAVAKLIEVALSPSAT